MSSHRNRRPRRDRCRCRKRRTLQRNCPRRRTPRRHRRRRPRRVHTPRASSWFPLRSRSPQGCLRIRIRTRRQSVADAAGVERSSAAVHIVADAIAIDVGVAIPAARAEGVELVSINRDPSGTSSPVHELPQVRCRCRKRRHSNAIVHVVANSPIGVSVACAAAHAEVVELVPMRSSPIGCLLPRSYTSPGPLQMPQASSVPTVVHVVADAIVIHVRVQFRRTRRGRRAGCHCGRSPRQGCRRSRIRKSRQARCRCRKRRVPTRSSTSSHAIVIHVHRPITAAHAEGVELVAIAVAVPGGDVVATAFVNLLEGVADAASVDFRRSRPRRRRRHRHPGLQCMGRRTPRASSWFPAVAVPIGDVFASAIINLARTVADAASVEHSNAIVHVVTTPIAIDVGVACPPHTPRASVVSIASSPHRGCLPRCRSRQVRCRCRSVRQPTQSSTSSQTPSSSTSAVLFLRIHRGRRTGSSRNRRIPESGCSTRIPDCPWSIARHMRRTPQRSRPRRRKCHLHRRQHRIRRRTPEGVNLVSGAIAIARRNVITSAFVVCPGRCKCRKRQMRRCRSPRCRTPHRHPHPRRTCQRGEHAGFRCNRNLAKADLPCRIRTRRQDRCTPRRDPAYPRNCRCRRRHHRCRGPPHTRRHSRRRRPVGFHRNRSRPRE